MLGRGAPYIRCIRDGYHDVRPRTPSVHMYRRLFVSAVVVVCSGQAVTAQVSNIRSATAEATGPILSELKHRQSEFEGYRRQRVPAWNSGRGPSGKCDEQVGRFCYWYDESEPPPPDEPNEIEIARNKLIAALDSSFTAAPSEPWTSGVLIRYLVEANRADEAVRVAGRCTALGWWCPALKGFALHAANRGAAADSAWSQALSRMDEKTRCDWRDLKVVLDDALLREYREVPCAQRLAQENRVWWLARPMLSSPGNDARSEFFARRLYAIILQDAPSVHELGFDEDERELSLRYGWPRAWSQSKAYVQGRGQVSIITGHEPAPAPPMLPTASSVRNPALSDSLGWRGKGLPGVRARYSPAQARHLVNLVHQAAVFRRGDSALVAVSYDVSGNKPIAEAIAAGKAQAGLVLTKGEESDATIVRLPNVTAKGFAQAKTPWGPMLMSAEVSAPEAKTLARARYGLKATDLPGNRVSISDLLLFEPYNDMPRGLDDVLPHAKSSQAIPKGGKVGIYWETYNTNPLGEGIQVAITVAPEEKDGSWLTRGLTALRLVRQAQPVSVGLSDVSSRGAGYTPRAVVVDLETLKAGRYLMQLEITAEGTPSVRAERVLTVR